MNSGTAQQQCFYHQHILRMCSPRHVQPPLSSNGLNRPCASCTCFPSCIFIFPSLITHSSDSIFVPKQCLHLSGRVRIKKTESKWSLDITGIDVWALAGATNSLPDKVWRYKSCLPICGSHWSHQQVFADRGWNLHMGKNHLQFAFQSS